MKCASNGKRLGLKAHLFGDLQRCVTGLRAAADDNLPGAVEIGRHQDTVGLIDLLDGSPAKLSGDLLIAAAGTGSPDSARDFWKRKDTLRGCAFGRSGCRRWPGKRISWAVHWANWRSTTTRSR